MYLLVNGALGFLLLTALICAAIGLLAFSPLALIASTLVFSLVGVGASFGLGRLYGIHSHLQSALITGLILALIFTPTLDSPTLLQYGLIAVIAQTSKFVITYKQRHLFNPAAIGALLGGLLQLSFASWWVSTPPLIIPMTLVVVAILYKTRRLQLGLVYIMTSLALLLATGATDAGTALTSWPILFVAGVMLSEPATLPPRRPQQFAVAAITACIASLPFHIGWFSSSPEFALLVGNLVAFSLAFRQRRGLQLTFQERRSLTPTTDELIFTSPSPLYFTPGQFIELTLPHPRQDLRGIRRSFSITSTPGEKEVRLGVKFYTPSSTFKKALKQLPVGAVVQTTGISGDFVLPRQRDRKLLFIAGGIGITPFVSHLQSKNNDARDSILLYFIHDQSEIAYKKLLEKSGATIYYFVAGGAANPPAVLQSLALTQEILATYVTDLADRDVFISGPPAMVATTTHLLARKARRVHTDYFNGY